MLFLPSHKLFRFLGSENSAQIDFVSRLTVDGLLLLQTNPPVTPNTSIKVPSSLHLFLDGMVACEPEN